MRLLSIVLSFLLFSGILFGQDRKDVDVRLSPLTLENTSNQRDYGFILGLGQTFQSGEQYVQCPECQFKGGAGFSFSVGMLYEYEFLKGIRIGGLAVYNDFSFSSKFQETEIKIDEDTGTELPVVFSHDGKFTLNAITAAPYVKMYPWNFMFFRIGMPISYILNNNIKHDKMLDNQSISVAGMEYTIEAVNATVEDGEIIGINKLQFFMSTALGFDFHLSRNIYLSPVFEYYLPFTEISSNGDASKVNNWKINFELRIALKDRSR